MAFNSFLIRRNIKNGWSVKLVPLYYIKQLTPLAVICTANEKGYLMT